MLIGFENKGNDPQNTKRYNIPVLTTIILLICIIVFYLEYKMVEANIDPSIILGFSIKETIFKLKIYQLITSVFTHGGIDHLIGNMTAHIIFGYIIENLYGSLFFGYLTCLLIIILGLLGIIELLILGWIFGGELYEIPSVGYSGVICGYMVLAFTQIRLCRIQCCCRLIGAKILWLPIAYTLYMFPELVNMYKTRGDDATNSYLGAFISTFTHFAGAIVGCFLLRKYGVFLTSHHTKCQNFDKDIEKMMEESTQRAIGFIPTNTVFLTETATQEVRVPATIQRDAQNMELGDYAPPTFIIQDVQDVSILVQFM